MRTVAIVGRPNVGKSALFNRLIGKKISIVHDMPGVTRDRIVAVCKQGRTPFQVIDTGGIGADVDLEFTDQVRAEVDIALETSDLLLFVVDGQTGLTGVDAEIAKRLRRISKPLILVVNKIDHSSHQTLPAEFTRLGFDPVLAVSAEHGLGMDVLIDRMGALLPSESPEEEAERRLIPLKIAIVGRPNVGKSSLTNAILQDERTLVSPISGTTRDAVDVPYQRGEQRYTLIDTAGIRPKSKRSDSVEIFSVMRSESSIERADLCCMVVDVDQGVSSQDKRIAGMIVEAGKPCVIVLNKWDLIEERTKTKEGMREELEKIQQQLFFLPYAPMVMLSAKTGMAMDRLFKRIENVREASRRRLGTGPLNRVFTTAMTNHPPALKSGRRFKVLYGTQPEPRGTSPIPVPEIVLFCNEKALLDDSYRRFLESRIREVEPWEGLPLKLILRERAPRTGAKRGAGGGSGKGMRQEGPAKGGAGDKRKAKLAAERKRSARSAGKRGAS
ncbi:MAG: ribosome biogenesis GTPase Der [Verrucomicrobiota bacterium]